MGMHADGRKMLHRWHIGYAALPEIPAALMEQPAVGGRMVVPVGTDQSQLLKVIDRTDDGLTETILEAVHFVPLVNGTATHQYPHCPSPTCAKTNRHTDAQA